MNGTLRAALMIAASSVGALPVSAHHSYAMFDDTKSVSVRGTVAKMEWMNPHAFVWMYVRGEGGHYDLYSFQSGSVSMLKRAGWTPTTLVAGEMVTVDYYPLRDGRHGGYLIKVTLPNGHVQGADPYAPGGAKHAPDPTVLK